MWAILRFLSIFPSHSFRLTFALRIECSRCFSLLIPWEKIVTIASLSLIQNLLLYRVQLFATPRTVAHQIPLSSTISQSLLKFMPIELVMPSNYLIFFCPLLFLPSIFPSIGLFQWVDCLHQVTKVLELVSATVIPVKIQGWFPLRLTGLILQSKGLSSVFFSTTIQKYQFFGTQPLYMYLIHCAISLKLTQYFKLVQFSSVAQSCLTLCDPRNRSMPGLPVHHQLPEFTQIHVHRVSDAIQPSHPLSSPSPPAPNLSQHQSLFQWVNSV